MAFQTRQHDDQVITTPAGASSEVAVIGEGAAVLNDVDAGVEQRTGDFVVADAEHDPVFLLRLLDACGVPLSFGYSGGASALVVCTSISTELEPLKKDLSGVSDHASFTSATSFNLIIPPDELVLSMRWSSLVAK